MTFGKLPLLLATLALVGPALRAADRPNILWITSEDNASHWIGCYGNTEASTPRIDALAATGLRFTRAYSNGPVCAVARSTLLNGAYAVTQGTEHMRSRHEIPDTFQSYPRLMRGLGYYCTNNAKTDYNFKGNDASHWDECGGQAHYRNRPAGAPFFAVFNLEVTHESNLFPGKVANNRKRGAIPEKTRLDPAKLTVPPHQPDLPEIRQDIAIYHDCVSAMDRQVGELLDDLKRDGLADDTIVFYYADHGGAMARGKRYLQDTGVRVPLVIHLPEKWKHLAPFPAGKEVSEPVAFVDFAPTVLSLAGQPAPASMQGRAFLGPRRAEPARDALVFLYADRFDETEGMRRALTDGRYTYIRCFTPHLPGAPYSEYQMGQPSWVAWQKAWKAGTLSGLHASIWQSPQPVEMLYDNASDPWSTVNLAAQPDQKERLGNFRERLRQTMADVRDTALVPEPMWDSLIGGKTIHEFVRSPKFDLAATLDLAFAASSRDSARLPELAKALASEDPVRRYWGAHGCLVLGEKAAPAAEALVKLLDDPQPLLRITAAQALVQAGQAEKGRATLLGLMDVPLSAETFQWLTNVLGRMELTASIPRGWAARVLADPKSPAFKKDYARQLRGETTGGGDGAGNGRKKNGPKAKAE